MRSRARSILFCTTCFMRRYSRASIISRYSSMRTSNLVSHHSSLLSLCGRSISFSLRPSSCFLYCSSAFFSSAMLRKLLSCSAMSSAHCAKHSCSSSRKARARWSTRLLSSFRWRIFSWRSRWTCAPRAFSIWSKPMFSRSSASICVIVLPATLILTLSEVSFFICSSISLFLAIWACLLLCSSRSISRRLRSSSWRARSASASLASCFFSFSMASRSWISFRFSLSSLRRSISSLR
mmetsp:Transcript_73424/g.157316  ORF Transcript_73424/g.157316 Transcript_73424/m.157316 type:complete len:237 (-) Transcript_73424:1806-2516(-)